MAISTISADRIRELLDYNATTGVFHWKQFRGGVARQGNIAGSMTSDGYVRICVDYRSYKAHRLAWLWVYGKLPDATIDHINGIRNDNRIVNLRDVAQNMNNYNVRGPRRHNRNSGIRGVKPMRGKWQARIGFRGKAVHLGTFTTTDEARAAFDVALARIHAGFPPT